jgi:hypothetical protein
LRFCLFCFFIFFLFSIFFFKDKRTKMIDHIPQSSISFIFKFEQFRLQNNIQTKFRLSVPTMSKSITTINQVDEHFFCRKLKPPRHVTVKSPAPTKPK